MEKMMKKFLISLMAMVPVVVCAVPAHSVDVAPSIVVIDSGTDPALFGKKIVAEACFLEYGKCPNGALTMDGPGASYIAPTDNAALNHGTYMLSIVARVNPAAIISGSCG